jgi:hypothetical protein
MGSIAVEDDAPPVTSALSVSMIRYLENEVTPNSPSIPQIMAAQTFLLHPDAGNVGLPMPPSA